MKSYVFNNNMNKCYPFRVKSTKSFVGASTHSWWDRHSIKGQKHAIAVYLLNKIFIES